MSSEKVQSLHNSLHHHQMMNEGSKSVPNQQQEAQQQKNQSLSFIRSQQQKNQNPKIGRPAKTDQQQQFKKYYMENKQKFQLQCQLLVYIHQNYFDEIIDNPINTRVSKEFMDRLFIANHCEQLYRVLLKLNQNYFKNSSYYPQKKLKYTSLIDVAYMCHTVKQKLGNKLSSIQLLLIIFFYLYNQKLINENFYQYFVKNLLKFREGMIFGPGGKNSPKLEKLDKLIICLALTLADLEGILIEQEIVYSEEEYSQSQSDNQGQDQKIKNVYQAKRAYENENGNGNGNGTTIESSSKPKKRFHEDNNHYY